MLCFIRRLLLRSAEEVMVMQVIAYEHRGLYMASEKKILANRQNAQFSTGPRTSRGKQVSKYNAATHGLSAALVLLPGEDAMTFEKFKADLIAELAPATRLEQQLVEQIAISLLRLNRVPRFEVAYHAWVSERHERDYDRADRMTLIHRQLANSVDPTNDLSIDEAANAGLLRTGRVIETILRDSDFLSRLDRHETHLMTQISRLWVALEEIRSKRPPDLLGNPDDPEPD